nr:MAG TPA: hypothetical protein [Caudoviricetes sp.]
MGGRNRVLCRHAWRVSGRDLARGLVPLTIATAVAPI